MTYFSNIQPPRSRKPFKMRSRSVVFFTCFAVFPENRHPSYLMIVSHFYLILGVQASSKSGQWPSKSIPKSINIMQKLIQNRPKCCLGALRAANVQRARRQKGGRGNLFSIFSILDDIGSHFGPIWEGIWAPFAQGPQWGDLGPFGPPGAHSDRI